MMIRQRNRSGVALFLSTVEWSIMMIPIWQWNVLGCRTSISALYYNLCAGVSHVRCTFDWVDRLQLEYIYCCTSYSFALSPTFCNVGTPGYHVSVNRFRQSILFEYPFCHRYGAIFIGMIVAAVYLFFRSFPLMTLIDWYIAVCMEVHGSISVPYEYGLIRLISSYLRPGLVLLYTSKWQLVH